MFADTSLSPTGSGRLRASPNARSAAVSGAVIALLASFAAAPTAVSAAEHEHGHVAEHYALQLLHPMNDGVASSALGVNDRGDVVGITRPTTSSRPQSTVLWESHGDHFHAHELPNLDGSSFSRGFAVNDGGTVVGEAFDATGASVPIIWGPDGTAARITAFNQAGTGILNDIDSAGTAVGTASGRAVKLTPDGTAGVLEDPPLAEGTTLNTSSAQAISELGEIAGRVSLSVPHGDHSHTELYPIVWGAEGARLLGLPDGASSPSVADITSEGQVVGSVSLAGRETATVWSRTGAETLPSPGIADYPHTAAKAGADDVFVGYASKFAGNTSFGGAAVAWDAHGAVDLNTRVDDLPAGVTLQSATGLNAGGTIVGAASTPDGLRGFVLTPRADQPAPQPATTEVFPASASMRYGTAGRLEIGVAVDLSAGIVPPASGPVSACFGGTVVTGALSEGKAALRIPPTALRPGEHRVPISYAGVDGLYAPSNGSATVTVRKAAVNLELRALGTRAKAGRTTAFRVIARSAGVTPTGRVTVRVAGLTKRVALQNGKATVRIRIPAAKKPGWRTATARYLGSELVEQASATARIRILRR